MQGVRPIGANNKIFLSEQAPTEYFIIHSCMSHSNSKIVAISTVKHLSRNYASFQQPSVQEWLAYPLLVRHKIFRKEHRWLSWRWIHPVEHRTEAEEISFVVCDVNSEKEQLQVKIFVFQKSEETLAMWRQNWLYAIDQKQRKNRKYAQIHFLDRQINFLCCSGICYASGQFYRNCRVSKNRECSMAAVANKTFPILCFCLGITRTFHPPYTPFATIKNLRYCLVCL